LLLIYGSNYQPRNPFATGLPAAPSLFVGFFSDYQQTALDCLPNPIASPIGNVKRNLGRSRFTVPTDETDSHDQRFFTSNRFLGPKFVIVVTFNNPKSG
jgi:hypothetical protein